MVSSQLAKSGAATDGLMSLCVIIVPRKSWFLGYMLFILVYLDFNVKVIEDGQDSMNKKKIQQTSKFSNKNEETYVILLIGIL